MPEQNRTEQNRTEQNRTEQNRTEKPARQSNLELFRIVLMLAIIAHHYVVNSGVFGEICKEPTASKSLGMLLFGAWGKTGINCFILITGYFMCQSKITLTKFLKLIFEVEFYNIIFFTIFLMCGYETLSLRHFINAVFPITSISSDFTSCFLIFYLCIPFVNILIHNMTNLQHKLLICLSLFTYTFLATARFPVAFNYVTWFIVLYFVASYVRIYPINLYDNLRFWSLAFIGNLLISCASVFFVIFVNPSVFCYFFIADSNKLLALTTAFTAFMMFKNLPIPYVSWINTVAKSTFGVLLIHANSDAMRQWLWHDTLQNAQWFHTSYFLLHAVVSVLGVYLICVLIDMFRIHFCEQPFFRWWNSCGEENTLAFLKRFAVKKTS